MSTNATQLTSDFKGDHLSVKMFGAVGDGITDDTVACQSAITTAASIGGSLYFPPGTYWVSGLTLPVGDPLSIYGGGVDATTIKLADSSNVPVFDTDTFATLTGSNTQAGLFRFRMSLMTVDGNKANQTAGAGLRLYGHAMILENIVVQNCFEDGIYSEWAVDSTFADPTADLESFWKGVKTIFNGGNGVTYRGPHDSVIQGFVTYGNGGWGFQNQTNAMYNGGGLHFNKVNAFLNTLGGFKMEDSFNAEDIAATTGTGTGMYIASSAGACIVTNGVFAGPTGLELHNDNNNIHGLVVNCSTTGVLLNGTLNLLHFNFFSNSGPVITFSGSANNTIICNGAAQSSGSVMFSGTPSSTDVVLATMSGLATETWMQFPDQNFIWDNVNHRLGLGVTPTRTLDVQGSVRMSGGATDAALLFITDSSDSFLQSCNSGLTAGANLNIGGPGAPLPLLSVQSALSQFTNTASGGVAQTVVRGGSGQSTNFLLSVEDSSGTPKFRVEPDGSLLFNSNLQGLYAGSSTPNGLVTANPGSLYLCSAGGAGVTLYIKESGSNTNTGWVSYDGVKGIDQLTGDVTAGPASGSATATLASIGTSGTYTKVTTDAKGRVTSGTTLSTTDLPGGGYPVTSVNGSTGAVTLVTGVSSVNGATGAVTLVTGVSSVNGATGAVTVSGGPTTQSTPSRSYGTTYQNTGSTARFVTISVTFAAATQGVTVFCDASSSPSTTVANMLSNSNGGSQYVPITFVVLPGYYYKVTSAGASYWSWVEWQ